MDEPLITEDMRRVQETWAGRPETYAVERGHLRDFVDAVGDPNPLWRDPNCARRWGYRDTPAPPTYLHTLHRHDDDPPIPMPSERILAASDEFVLSHPIYPGDTLTATSRVSGLWEKQGRPEIGRMLFIQLEHTYTNQDGVEVGKMYHTHVSYVGTRAG